MLIIIRTIKFTMILIDH